jgi:hypothetical protein
MSIFTSKNGMICARVGFPRLAVRLLAASLSKELLGHSESGHVHVIAIEGNSDLISHAISHYRPARNEVITAQQISTEKVKE